jgi:outer membrane protein TolC
MRTLLRSLPALLALSLTATGGLALGQEKKAAASSAPKATAAVPSVSLSSLEEAVRRSPESQAAASAVKQASDAATDAARAAARPDYELEAEYTKPEEAKPQVGAWLGTTIRLGVDRDALTRQHESEGRASQADSEASLLDATLLAADDFVELLRLQRLVAATSAISKEIEPYVARAEQAAQRGDADGLAAVKWRLFADALRAEQRSAAEAFKALARHFKAAYGLDVAEDPAAASLVPVTAPAKATERGDSPAARAETARALAAEARALAFDDARTFDLALGVEKDMESGFTSVSARLTVPLSQGSLARAEAASAMAERSAGSARAEMTKRQDQRAMASLRVRSQMAAAHVSNLEERKTAVRALLTRTIGALGRGLAEGAAAVEAADALLAAEQDLADAYRDYERAVAEQQLRQGGTP